MRQAMAKVEAANPPNETAQAAAVLKEGAGADEKLKADHAKAAEKAAEDAAGPDPEASERARKGWETRRENEAKAAAEAAKPAEQPAAKAAETAPAPEQAAVESKFKEPPKRFVLNDKADWDKVPESVRAEIDRGFRNLEEGFTKHKEGAERWAKLADFEKLSQQYYKRPFEETAANYIEMDKLLSQDLLAGLERIVGSRGYKDGEGNYHPYTLKQIAQHVLEQEGVERFDNESADLKREIANLKREMADMRNGSQQRQQSETETRRTGIQKQIDAFAKDAPRWAELESHVSKILNSDLVDRTGDPVADLKAAYEMANRLNPAPSLSPPAPEIPSPDPEAQRRKGQASVSGAPGNGSAPAAKKPAPQTIRDAIHMAKARVGVA